MIHPGRIVAHSNSNGRIPWNGIFKRPIHIAILATLLLANGCGSPLGATVKGTVTLDDKPLTVGAVMFFPIHGGAPGLGAIRADGSFEIMTGRQRGLAPGEYIVTVVANEPTELPADGGPPPPGKPLTPAKYRDRRTSDLRETVTKGSNVVSLLLTADKS